ncbi:MAG: hypothetical protein JXQ90_22345 [Cyclobacteriaceae bacterium]
MMPVLKNCIYMLLLLTYQFVQGQHEQSKAVYFELAGSGGLGSINYEKQFYQKNNMALALRAGLSVAPIDKNNGAGLVFPIMMHSIIGTNAHKLEFGLGQGVTITTKGSFFALTTGALGYRYQADNKPWFYRATYTPLISYLIDFQVQHWAGLSVGYTLQSNKK